ncbi:MAG TPA: hypothetical protein VFX59_16385 [Polyangiales bacterium]|nr:hypothetical protein [Polyangiales bacterium]
MSRRRHRKHDWLAVVSQVGDEVQLYQRRRQQRLRHRRSRAARIVRAVLWALFASVAFVPLMFALGFTMGWSGIAVLIVALMGTYGGLLHWVLRKPEPPKLPQLTAGAPSSGLAQLPARTSDWLEQERELLPSVAQPKLDSLSDHLDALTPQVAALTPDHPSTQEVRRLIGEELPQLISGWHKVPNALRTQPLYGGSTPERQLVDGLDTIDKQLIRLSEQLAKDDLHALATHQRYLDMKYNKDE